MSVQPSSVSQLTVVDSQPHQRRKSERNCTACRSPPAPMVPCAAYCLLLPPNLLETLQRSRTFTNYSRLPLYRSNWVFTLILLACRD